MDTLAAVDVYAFILSVILAKLTIARNKNHIVLKAEIARPTLYSLECG